MVGYSVQKKESFSSTYICPQCLLLLRDPVQLINCGHRLCLSCIDEQQSDVITCAECHTRTFRENSKLDRGSRNDMQILEVVCVLCNWTGILRIYQNHLDLCHPNPICIHCGDQFTSVHHLDQHQRNHCDKITIYCPLKQFGCEDMMLRSQLRAHYSSEQHQNTLLNIVRLLKTASPNTTHSNLKTSSSMIVDAPHIAINQLQEIDELINIMSPGVASLSDDLPRLSAECIQQQKILDHLTLALPTLKISIQEQNSSVDGVKTSQEILQRDLQSTEQKLNDMKGNSYDGIFIWQISQVQTKLNDAQSEKQISIYSPAFYSSPSGYKACLRIYFNGDGNGKRTHISLFFVLMRGEYDAILKFPFHYKVIFCLFDQTENQNHIIDSFQPDIRSNSFHRPQTDMNTASGIPKFAPLTIFQQKNNSYVRDDTMFIKVIIDFNDTPKALLPYACSLNPGLTSPLQQTMIRQETEKRHKSSVSTMRNAPTD